MNKLKRLDIMVDLETLSHKSKAPMIQLGAELFDIETGEVLDTFNKYISDDDVTISRDTMNWWLDNHPMQLKRVLKRGNVSTREALADFHGWVYRSMNGFKLTPKDVYLWGNGILFDNRILFDHMGDAYPIFYRNDRDMRTLVDMYTTKFGISPWDVIKVENTHDALEDCENQILIVTHCWKELMK